MKAPLSPFPRPGQVASLTCPISLHRQLPQIPPTSLTRPDMDRFFTHSTRRRRHLTTRTLRFLRVEWQGLCPSESVA
ncbi:hypothetical protein M407DRAFT_87884 [Tulasnella calospora MUT 4182]|uniref:Uncharacterized protein n=1 Tax=Tulasnella calospora MUT 4182 TaxID=1051891 RepID=A0A0C3LKB2_9AGAM|nr:hypothetical protein M407DRAFT_87884 [Tulasnella calospora MUT 4182]